MLLVVATDPAPHTVRGSANYLNVTKAVISRALDCLVELDYLRRIPDRRDRRNILIAANPSGQAILKDLADDLKNR